MLIVLIGPPGCGKGTQGKILAKKINFLHLNVGQILRQFAQNEPSGKTKAMLKEGKLFEDAFINSLVIDKISQNNTQSHILDGMPRTLAQAQYLSDNYQKKILAINFRISKDVLIKRIIGRYTCMQCGATYNEYTLNTKIQGVCDICNNDKFSKRDDDNETSLKTRLEEYNNNSKKILQYYKDNILNVNAEDDILNIETKLMRQVSDYITQPVK